MIPNICKACAITAILLLLQIHSWDRATNIEETLHAFNDLVRTGKVHYIGVSNVTGWQLQKIVETNKKFGYPQIASLQASFTVNKYSIRTLHLSM